MTLKTRIEKDVLGYNGINFYNENGEYIGDIVFKDTKTGKTKLTINIDGLKVVPKAVDDRNELFDYTDCDDDIIE